jgi:hypothetical protein
MVKQPVIVVGAMAIAVAFGAKPSTAAEPEAAPAPSASSAPAAEAPPATASASAAEATEQEPGRATSRGSGEPTAHHAPRATAIKLRDVELSLTLDFAERVKAAWLVYRVGGETALRTVPFARGGAEGFTATIPAEHVTDTGIAYAIELERSDGKRVPVFASRAELHEVSVHEDPRDLGDLRERVELARLGGRRSEIGATADYVSFGRSDVERTGATGLPERASVSDGYYRLEGRYTHRLLRSVSEFSLRLGVVRGTAPVELTEAQRPDDPYAVGLNYGATSVRFQVRDEVAFEPGLLLSVNQVAFSFGYSGALLLGDTRGAHVRLGFETIQVFGSRYVGRLEVPVTERVRVAPSVELTNMPSATDYGVRLLGEVSLDLGGGLGVAARGGYQAREAASGGPAAGGELRWAF